jgi:IS5 family transposase
MLAPFSIEGASSKSGAVHFNELRSRIRSRVEHVFGIIKCVFGFDKLRYRGLAKNANRLFTTCALANLLIVRRKLA